MGVLLACNVGVLLAGLLHSLTLSNTKGSLPPNSRITGVRVFDASAMTILPTLVEPTKVIKDTSRVNAAPAAPYPQINCTRSEGAPAASRHAEIMRP